MDAEAATSIVLIHGLWMTPRSWELWAARYEERGHRVTGPGRPHFPGAPGWEEVADYALDWALRTRRS
jgi:pimeloyl-ACP methyl ester carboxylesterase